MRPRSTFRFLGRSFLALVFTPEPPFAEWLAELDAWLGRSNGFFADKPVVLDLSRVTLTQLDYIGMMTELEIRKIRIISVEGVDPDWRDPSHAPLGGAGRSGNVIEFPDPPASDSIAKQAGLDDIVSDHGPAVSPQQPDLGTGTPPSTPSRAIRETLPPDPQTESAQAEHGSASEAVQSSPPHSAPPARAVCATPSERLAELAPTPEACSLLLETPVRSGQSVVFPFGDVTVVGSVASGAEVVAGGSIHIYGALRGRAIAGSRGDRHARIFCARLEAELLAINGLYKTADDMEPDLRSKPVQAWLDGEVMKLKSQE